MQYLSIKLKSIIIRIAISITGPIIFSAANFLAALLLQQLTSSISFGLYAFGHVVIATGLAISNGLFSSPLLVALKKKENDEKIIGSFSRVNFVYCFVGGFSFFLLIHYSGMDYEGAGLFSMLAGLFWFRWFLRSLALIKLDRLIVSLSDTLYGSTLILLIAAVYFFCEINIYNVIFVQIVACVFSYFSLFSHFKKSFSLAKKTSSSTFWSVFKNYGAWSLVGVISMNITSSAHAYILTLMMGPATFAPIAVITLFFRPMSLVLTALIQFERPTVAVYIRDKSILLLNKTIAYVQFVVGGIWTVNVCLIFSIFYFWPELLTRNTFDSESLMLAAVLLTVILFVRGMREPLAVVLQSVGEFKYIAHITIVTAPLGVFLIISLLLVVPSMPSLSLVGAFVSEIIIIYLIFKRKNIILKSLRSD